MACALCRAMNTITITVCHAGYILHTWLYEYNYYNTVSYSPVVTHNYDCDLARLLCA